MTMEQLLAESEAFRKDLGVKRFIPEPMTSGGTIDRSKAQPYGRAQENKRKTHCLRGHPLSEGNLYEYTHPRTGYKFRQCKACRGFRVREKEE